MTSPIFILLHRVAVKWYQMAGAVFDANGTILKPHCKRASS